MELQQSKCQAFSSQVAVQLLRAQAMSWWVIFVKFMLPIQQVEQLCVM